MSASWKIAILLGCAFWRASQAQSTCAWNNQQTTVCVPAGGNVTVPCLKPKAGEEMTFTLFKDGKKIHNHSCNFDKHEFKCTLNPSVGVVQQYKNESLSFILTGLAGGSHGMYICEVRVMFPPPSKELHNASRILVIVEGDLFQCRKKNSGPGEHQIVKPHWIWVSLIAALCSYSVIVTVITVINYIKLRHSDFQNDYINAKPRTPINRKKKSWILNPTRHF